ncbi:MAG: PAS domain-containing protein [Rhodospirillaceae bacterium]|nr:MAG: PAS domain-containing protein [Rhodospirillaceae bacterium]
MLDPVASDAAEQSARADFIAHWRTLHCENGVPSVAGFLDQALPRFAPWTMIVDVEQRGTLPLRLIGTRLADTFGEQTGNDFLFIMPSGVRSVVRRAHQLMCTLPCGWHTESLAVTSGGREVIVELISLPLRNKGSISCVVKLAHIVAQLDYREALVNVVDLRNSTWVDLGAGVP